MLWIIVLIISLTNAFDINRIMATGILSSSMFLNNGDLSNMPLLNPHILQPMEIPTKISVDHNNIYLYGPISIQSCEELKNKITDMDYSGRLFKLEYDTNPPPINLHIQSEGGSLLNVLYLVDLIEMVDTPVNTYIDGYSASAASLLNVVGKKRYMSQNSLMLIHQLTSEKEGKYQELDDEMQNLQLLMNKIKAIYLKHSTIPYEQLNEILKHDIWLDATTCKKYGLVDEIL